MRKILIVVFFIPFLVWAFLSRTWIGGYALAFFGAFLPILIGFALFHEKVSEIGMEGADRRGWLAITSIFSFPFVCLFYLDHLKPLLDRFFLKMVGPTIFHIIMWDEPSYH